MNPLQIMEMKKEHFTPNEYSIYQAIVSDPGQMISLTTSALAARCGVSQPAITRFVKNLGYERFQDFRMDLTRCLSQAKTQGPQAPEPLLQDPLLCQFIDLLQDCQPVLCQSYMKELSSYLSSFRRIYATGISKSYQPAELMEIISRKLSLRFHAVRQDFLAEICDYLNQDDLLIFFSVSGHEDLMKYIPNTSARIMLVTCNPQPKCAKYIDRLVCFPIGSRNPEVSCVSPILFDLFVDLLIKELGAAKQQDSHL